MGLSGAERQARWRARRQAELDALRNGTGTAPHVEQSQLEQALAACIAARKVLEERLRQATAAPTPPVAGGGQRASQRLQAAEDELRDMKLRQYALNSDKLRQLKAALHPDKVMGFAITPEAQREMAAWLQRVFSLLQDIFKPVEAMQRAKDVEAADPLLQPGTPAAEQRRRRKVHATRKHNALAAAVKAYRHDV